MNAPSRSGSAWLEPQPPVRVVHLVTSLAIGGLEKVVLDLVRYRTRDRFGARVICLDASGVLQQGFAELGVPVESIGTAGSVPARIVRLARRLRQLRPDVLHTHNPQAHLHGTLAARLAGVPVVIHTRHGRQFLGRQPLAAFSRLASRWASEFVAVSEDAASLARETERVPERKLHVIRNGIDVTRFDRPAGTPAAPGGRAISVGRLDPIKDHATLLRAVRLVTNTLPTFELDLVGDGPSRVELESLARALELGSHVRFLGYREDVGALLASADFFVLSSISEGLSLALLESMAAGLPVVATDVGGNREVVVPGDTGYLVPARSADALAAAMMTLLADAAKAGRMGRAARRRIESHFNVRTVVAQYERMYATSLGRDRTGRVQVA
jgi:sugar transferase (PEP-CTERM/EpsH1 system associated)